MLMPTSQVSFLIDNSCACDQSGLLLHIRTAGARRSTDVCTHFCKLGRDSQGVGIVYMLKNTAC